VKTDRESMGSALYKLVINGQLVGHGSFETLRKKQLLFGGDLIRLENKNDKN